MSQQGKTKEIGTETLTGNTGGAVGPDGSNNINILGAAPITVTGNPGINTLTVEDDGTIATTFTADTGTATPSVNNIDILGTSVQGITTSGAGDTITLTNDDATTTQKGVSELATDAETITGTDAARTIVPSSLSAKLGTQTDNGVAYGDGSTNSIGWTPALTDGQLVIGSTAGVPSSGSLTSTGNTIDVTAGSNTLNVDLSADVQTTGIHGWNGSTLETPFVTVTSDGATITANVEREGGGDLTVVFSDGFFDWDTTPPATVTLTAGTDTNPVQNYIFFPQATKTLTANTTGFPTAEHNPVATTICQSAASLQTDGAIKLHLWTDHLTTTTSQGHIPDVSSWIRNQNATWTSGVVQTFDITTNVGTPDNVLITTTAGEVLELHPHSYPAFTGTPDYYVINDSITPYMIVNDLSDLLTDSTGASMSGRFFSLVLWGSIGTLATDKFFINLPSGSYANSTSLQEDASGFANFSIPQEFKGAGFLIAQWNLRHQASSGGTWTSIEEIDLRGLVPSLAPGGTTASLTMFSDNVFRIFDDGDDTKNIAFEASPITTATTRTITMVDADLDLAEVPTSFTGDSGSATPALNSLSVVGGNGITTSGSGSTVTITSDNAGIDWTEVTGTSQAMVVDNGYIASNVGLVTLTLPVTTVIGDIIRVDGKGSGGWTIAQNASQTIHFLAQDTTTGVGGSLASTTRYDCVTLRCITANTDFVVESVTGSLTVV